MEIPKAQMDELKVTLKEEFAEQAKMIVAILRVENKEMEKRLTDKIDSLDRRMEMGFEQVDQRFEQVDQRFEQVDQRFEQVDKKFELLEGKLTAKIEQSETNILEAHGDVLGDHETRLVTLEQKVLV